MSPAMHRNLSENNNSRALEKPRMDESLCTERCTHTHTQHMDLTGLNTSFFLTLVSSGAALMRNCHKNNKALSKNSIFNPLFATCRRYTRLKFPAETRAEGNKTTGQTLNGGGAGGMRTDPSVMKSVVPKSEAHSWLKRNTYGNRRKQKWVGRRALCEEDRGSNTSWPPQPKNMTVISPDCS